MADRRTKPPMPRLQASHPLARGLVLALEISERTGNLLFDSGPRRSHAALTAVGFAPDRFGPRADFNGSTSYGNAGTVFAPSSTSVTVEAIARTTLDTADIQTIVCKASATVGWPLFALRYRNNRRPQFSVCTAGGYNEAQGAQLALGELHHLIGVRRGTTVEVWADGALQGSSTASTNDWRAGGGDLTVGRADSGYPVRLTGGIDRVRVWDRALTAGEIAALFEDAGALTRPRRVSLLWSAAIGRILAGAGAIEARGALSADGAAVRQGRAAMQGGGSLVGHGSPPAGAGSVGQLRLAHAAVCRIAVGTGPVAMVSTGSRVATRLDLGVGPKEG